MNTETIRAGVLTEGQLLNIAGIVCRVEESYGDRNDVSIMHLDLVSVENPEVKIHLTLRGFYDIEVIRP